MNFIPAPAVAAVLVPEDVEITVYLDTETSINPDFGLLIRAHDQYFSDLYEDHTTSDRETADEVLNSLHYLRTSGWVESGDGQYIATVQAL